MSQKLAQDLILLPLSGERIFQGRGKQDSRWNDINIDYYPPIIHISSYRDIPKEQLNELVFKLSGNFGESLGEELCILNQKRFLKKDSWEVLKGNLPEQAYAHYKDCRFKLEFMKNKNIGFFPDFSLGRDWIFANAEDKKVLNLFSYTCSLSLIAIKGGAKKVINIDMSRSVLNWGRENHRLNNIDMDKVEFRQNNIMKSLGAMTKKGPFDLIIIDPPSLQKGSFDLEKDYQKIIRRLEGMAAPGALIMACLNSPFHSSEFLKDIFAKEAKSFSFEKVLFRDHRLSEDDPEKGLKICLFKKL